MQTQTIRNTSVDEIDETPAAADIARYWYEQKNWLRLETLLTDREVLLAILPHCRRDEMLEWWVALERETGVRVEERYEQAWRRWELDETSEKTADFGCGIVSILYGAGRCGDFVERLVRTAMRVDAGLYGDQSGIVGAHLDMLARILDIRGDHILAEQACRRALAIAERLDGADSSVVSARLHILGCVFMTREDYAQAAWTFRRALSVAEKADGSESGFVATILQNLVRALVLNGEPERAEQFARRDLDVLDVLHGPNHPSVIESCWTLAVVLEHKGDSVEITKLCRRAVQIAETCFGQGHPDTIRARVELADRLANGENAGEAEAMYRSALATIDGDGANWRVGLPWVLGGLANLLGKQERHDEAVPLLARVLEIVEAGDEPDPRSLVCALQHLGVAYRGNGAFEEAEWCLLRAKTIAEENGPEAVLRLAAVLSAIGQLRFLEKNYTEAEVCFLRCLEIRRERLEEGHPDILRVEERLAAVRGAVRDELEGVGSDVPSAAVELDRLRGGRRRTGPTLDDQA